jgi:hypothetical protein
VPLPGAELIAMVAPADGEGLADQPLRIRIHDLPGGRPDLDPDDASGVREDGRIRGSRSVNEPSTASVWAGRRGRLVACRDNRATPATLSPFQKTTRRRPFAEDRRRGPSPAQSPAQVGKAAGSRQVVRTGAVIPPSAEARHRRRQQWQQPAPARPR